MISESGLKAALKSAPIVPVLTIPDAGKAGALASVFAQAGVKAVEITLRTEAGLQAITEMKRAEPGLIVGAGTILNEGDLDAAMKAGAEFHVSPGMAPRLREAALSSGAIMIPGIATPSEAMTRFDEGFEFLKLFPAEVVGGVAMLKGMAGPLPHIAFMPTGGVTQDNLSSYLSLPNVVAAGGTWLAKPEDIEAEAWDQISGRCSRALEACGAPV